MFYSPTEALESFAVGEHAVPFPVLGDPKKKIYKLYGVRCSLLSLFNPTAYKRVRESMRHGIKPKWRDAIRDGFCGKPADFLIDEEGRIVQAHYGAHFTDSVQPDEVLGW